MSEHANIVELDEAAAGLAPAQVRAHLEGCEACRGSLARVAAERESLIGSPRFLATMDKLPRARPRARWRWALVPALAACLALLVFARSPGSLRSKGSASLQAVLADGRAAESPRAGDLLELRAAPGEHRFALVAERDSRTVLWPASGAKSGPLAPGEHVAISVKLTPGPVHFVAAFSDGPLSLDEALAAAPGAELRTLDLVAAP